mmetsp:Transcript_99010/g.156685  ORF Transcript_99010/g.156685 Transcript_99010/m.156685 type:complete len:195 (-) Transcript_99010:76-660(-)
MLRTARIGERMVFERMDKWLPSEWLREQCFAMVAENMDKDAVGPDATKAPPQIPCIARRIDEVRAGVSTEPGPTSFAPTFADLCRQRQELLSPTFGGSRSLGGSRSTPVLLGRIQVGSPTVLHCNDASSMTFDPQQRKGPTEIIPRNDPRLMTLRNPRNRAALAPGTMSNMTTTSAFDRQHLPSSHRRSRFSGS